MYILQVFCALAIASLCTDVEASWAFFGNRPNYLWYTSWQRSAEVMKFGEELFLDDRKYTDTETVYFKVICDSSPVTINNIKVVVKSGNFLLSAESATSNICSGQTSECLGTKQIQENEFFISVKPNHEFTGGQLTLKLAQAGKIYVINHEGARFFNKNGLRLYSGFFPVMFPEKLPQYKITCIGRCQISKISGFGEDYDIVMSRYPVKIWEMYQDRCIDCLCTTERRGLRVHCKRGGSEQFNLWSSSFYITLGPRKEGKAVIDVEVTIQGGEFKSVEKLDYDASTPYNFYQQTHTKPLLFKVTCASSCTIKNILVDGVSAGGKFLLSAESATAKICSGQSKQCLATKQIQEKEFFIYVKPKPSFYNGKLTVDLGQNGTIYERADAHEGARLYNKDNIAIYIGHNPVKFPNLLPQYEITCNGNCRISEIFGRGQKIEGSGPNYVIAASEQPAGVLEKEGGCFNCFCVSSKNDGGNTRPCKKGRSSRFNLQSDRFYITLVPDPEAKNTWVHVYGSNFKGMTKVARQTMTNLKVSGMPGAVYRFPGFQGTKIQNFLIDFFAWDNNRRYYIEILTDAEVKAIFVSRPDVLQFTGYCNKTCTDCSCNTRNGCENFEAWMNPANGFYYSKDMKVRVVLKGRKGIQHPAYLRVSGKKFKDLFLTRNGDSCIHTPKW